VLNGLFFFAVVLFCCIPTIILTKKNRPVGRLLSLFCLSFFQPLPNRNRVLNNEKDDKEKADNNDEAVYEHFVSSCYLAGADNSFSLMPDIVPEHTGDAICVNCLIFNCTFCTI